MENEVLQEILDGLKDLKTGQEKLDGRLGAVEAELLGIKDYARNTNNALVAVEAGLALTKDYVRNTRNALAAVEADLAETKDYARNTNDELATLKADLSETKDYARNTNDALVVIENLWLPRIMLALEGISDNREKLDDHDARIGNVEAKVARQSLEIDLLNARQA